MPLTPQYLTNLITQLDILLDSQCEQMERLQLIQPVSDDDITVESIRQEEQNLLALQSIQKDHDVVHDLQRRLIVGLNWASMVYGGSHATHTNIYRAASTSAAENTSLF